jgi:hypothetical protein
MSRHTYHADVGISSSDSTLNHIRESVIRARRLRATEYLRYEDRHDPDVLRARHILLALQPADIAIDSIEGRDDIIDAAAFDIVAHRGQRVTVRGSQPDDAVLLARPVPDVVEPPIDPKRLAEIARDVKVLSEVLGNVVRSWSIMSGLIDQHTREEVQQVIRNMNAQMQVLQSELDASALAE